MYKNFMKPRGFLPW